MFVLSKTNIQINDTTSKKDELFHLEYAAYIHVVGMYMQGVSVLTT